QTDRSAAMGYFLVLTAAILAAVVAFGGTEPITFTLVQATVWVLAAVALWRERSGKLLGDPATKWIALLLAYVAFQWAAVAESPPEVRDSFLRWVTYVCVFYLAILVGRESKLRHRLVLALLVLGLVESLYGLTQYLAGWPYVLTLRNPFYVDRATGTFINANHFSGLLEMVLPLGFGLVLYQLERLKNAGRGRREEPSEQILRLVFYFFLSLLVFLGILFSRSRMGIFSALVAVLGMFLLWATASWRRSRAIPILLAFVLGAGALGLWLGLEPVVERFEALEASYLARQEIWKDTVSLIKAHPFFGTGLGTFFLRYTEHQTTALTRLVDQAHNDYLQFAAELGLVGAALFFGLIFALLIRQIVAFYRAERGRDRFLLLGCCGSVLALLFHGFADFNLQIAADALIFVTILGLGYAVSRTPLKTD
ncbi:O-antigen ligase family protein, partial [Acidobacteriia bacterium AH_259_A11_L15]|nr:O-antigen ligase family protein [Acidobacteriia bacterium AH_259_A11_L15]